MIRIGILGDIGSGKSFVAKSFGCPVFNADNEVGKLYKKNRIMKNPIKFIQEVKQEAFKVTWPTWKETLQGALMVFVMAVVMSLFFLLLDQVLKFFLELLLKVSI